MLCGIQENLAGMRFYDEVSEQLIASSIKDAHATVIEACQLRPIPEVEIFFGGVVHDAVHSQFKLY
jgi:hypothetical protein